MDILFFKIFLFFVLSLHIFAFIHDELMGNDYMDNGT